MYRCEACKTVVPAGTPQVRVVLETRRKTYDITPQLSEKEKKKARRRGMNVDRTNEFATGWEIAREAALCPQCAAAWARQQAEQGLSPDGAPPPLAAGAAADDDGPVEVASV